MKKNVLFIVLLIFFSLLFGRISLAQDCGHTNDPKLGNVHYWCKDSLGYTQVRSYNFDSGSRWLTTIKPDGDMKGWDSDTNYWEYDSRTRIYYNFGTGEIRYSARKNRGSN